MVTYEQELRNVLSYQFSDKKTNIFADLKRNKSFNEAILRNQTILSLFFFFNSTVIKVRIENLYFGKNSVPACSYRL